MKIATSLLFKETNNKSLLLITFLFSIYLIVSSNSNPTRMHGKAQPDGCKMDQNSCTIFFHLWIKVQLLMSEF